MRESSNDKTIIIPTQVLVDILTKVKDPEDFSTFMQSFQICTAEYTALWSEVCRNIEKGTQNEGDSLRLATIVFVIASFVRDNMDLLQDVIRVLDYRVLHEDANVASESIMDRVNKNKFTMEEYREL